MSEGDSVGESIHGKPSVVAAFFTRVGQIYQSWLDKSTPFYAVRWAATLLLTAVYMIRVYILQGWYIVTYALGIYHLNLFIAFLSPKVDPSLLDEGKLTQLHLIKIFSSVVMMCVEQKDEGPALPTKQNEEFRPFIRRLPEFKFWHSATKGIIIAMICTFFDAFNVPVFWPILVMYFIMLFCITMKRQIKHMIKYRYLPFTHGKRTYKGKEDTGKAFARILDLISVNNQVKPWEEPHKNLSKVIAVVGTYTSTETRTVAPLFMMDLIPMHFNWRWVAFLNVDDDYGNDGRDLFIKKIAGTKICLAYTKGLNFETNHNQIYQQIQAQRIRVIIVFAPEYTAEPLIEAAIRLNITNKVWIAGDAWSLNKKLPKVAAELKKSNFTLLNQNIHFNENGDPMAGVYSIVYWNHSGDAVEVGFYKFPPSPHFFVNGSKIRWHTDGEVPTSVCSPECPVGHAKKQDGIHECCFSCVICPNGTYLNITEDPYKCIECKETEWSEDGSTSCSLRSVEYIAFTDTEAILLMGGAGSWWAS
ncbi:hypothetical protein INR49_022367 [Caranx melampygus]|nr:hypothetical protein INR49_022367 [Caranx melampygus]